MPKVFLLDSSFLQSKSLIEDPNIVCTMHHKYMVKFMGAGHIIHYKPPQ